MTKLLEAGEFKGDHTRLSVNINRAVARFSRSTALMRVDPTGKELIDELVNEPVG